MCIKMNPILFNFPVFIAVRQNTSWYIISMLCIGIHVSVNGLSIQVLTMEQKYVVGKECYYDFTVSNSVVKGLACLVIQWNLCVMDTSRLVINVLIIKVS